MACFGYDGHSGNVCFYDNSAEIKSFKAHNKSELYAELIFDEILKNTNVSEIESFCVCFCSCKTSIRKEILEFATKIGFKKVGIIDAWTAVYLSLALQTNFSPKNGDIIWIVFQRRCLVWKKENNCATFVAYFGFAKDMNFDDLLYDVKYEPTALFIEPSNSEFDIKFVKEVFPSCIFETYLYKNIEYSAMIKARIMAGDQKVMEWDARPMLQFKTLICQEKEIIAIINSMQTLPLNRELKLQSITAPIIIGKDPRFLEEFVNPGSILCQMYIDINGIYSFTSINPDEESNDVKTDIFLPKSYMDQVFNFPIKFVINDYAVEAVGIDLGTSRCCAAVNRRNGIETVALEKAGGRLLPSYVGYDEPHFKCGQIVIDRLKYHAKSTIFDSKRIIGRGFREIEIDSIWPFTVKNLNSKILIEIKKVNEESFIKPEEVSASLLEWIKDKCETFQGKPLSKAVITVPAVFTELQKDATMKAAKLAGWNSVHLLPEPIAASFAYFMERPISNQSIILIFDLGGGTLDVCFSIIDNNKIQIISQNGDSQLGGRDFDKVLINYFDNLLISKYGISTEDKKFKLMCECQNVKEALSTADSACMDVEDFDTTKKGFMEISRIEFEKMTLTLLNRIRNIINAALFDADLKPSHVYKVLLVGGGSRMPMIKNLLKEIFSTSEHCCDTNPDEVVAVGAAYYAYYLFSNRRE